MASRGSIRARCIVCRADGVAWQYCIKLIKEVRCKHKEVVFQSIYKTEVNTWEKFDEAINCLSDAKLRYHKNPDFVKRKPITFKEVALQYLESKKKSSKVGIKAWTNYNSTIENHLLKKLGDCLISKITPKMVEEIRESVQNQSPSLQQKVNMRMNAIFRRAAREELIKDSPAKNLDKLDAEADINYSFLEPSQINDLLNAASSSFLRLYYKIPIYTGLRAGEVAGLMWDCVNIEARWIEVKRVLIWLTKKEMARTNHPTPWIIKPAPKSKAGLRRIPIDDELAKELQIFKIEQPENRFNLVFAQKKMAHNKKAAFNYPNEPMPINPAVLNPNCFKDDAENAGILSIKYHELRHTFCSLAYAAGIPESMVMYYMGHKDAAVTRGIYRHLLDEEKRKGAGFAQKIASMIGSSVPKLCQNTKPNKTKQTKTIQKEVSSQA